MRLTHTRRFVLSCVTAVMLLGGSASGMSIVLPTVDWTQVVISGSGTAAEDSATLDGHLLAYEYENGIWVRNLATGVTRTIPSTGGTQRNRTSRATASSSRTTAPATTTSRCTSGAPTP